jgi:chloride channel protein, CIC family
MAACLGAIAHAPIAVTVMAVEVTGRADLLAPAMVAVLAAVLVVGDATLYRSQLRGRAERTAAPTAEGGRTPETAASVAVPLPLPGLVEPEAVDGQRAAPGGVPSPETTAPGPG